MLSTEIRLIIFFADKEQKQDQELTGSDHELLIAKFRLKLKKIGKTARPFRIKKAEHRRIDAFELWCWRRLLRVTWIVRRSNQSILKEISPGPLSLSSRGF